MLTGLMKSTALGIRQREEDSSWEFRCRGRHRVHLRTCKVVACYVYFVPNEMSSLHKIVDYEILII